MLMALRFMRPLAAGWARAWSSSIDEHRACGDLGEGQDDNLEGLEGGGRVDDDGCPIVADTEEAADLVGGTKEGAAKVLGVVEEDNFLPVVGREENAVWLVESRHFFVRRGLEVHCAGETGDVAVA